MTVTVISLALACALTYACRDIYAGFLLNWMSWLVDAVVCIVLYRLTSHYLKNLKD